MDTAGEPIVVFDKHSDYVMGLVQLADDIAASIGRDGKLFT